MSQKTNHYFAFMDESGNSRQERFFGLGLLIIDDEIGDFYDSTKVFRDKILDNAKLIKAERIRLLKEQNEIEQLARIAGSSKNFELKFSYINYSNNLLYKALIQNYFKFSNIRFCALIIDRKDPKFPYTNLEPWDVYIHRAAMLLTNNLKNISPCNVTILADDLTRPKNVKKTFESSLKDSVNNKVKVSVMESAVMGISRIESHSSLMVQVTDILLGAVMYDYKKEAGLISEKQEERQEIVAHEIREHLGVDSLALSKTFHKPNYFSVWKFQK